MNHVSMRGQRRDLETVNMRNKKKGVSRSGDSLADKFRAQQPTEALGAAAGAAMTCFSMFLSMVT